MQTNLSLNQSYHLFSNFLTHSYFTLIENWLHCEKQHHVSLTSSLALKRALKSFIFVFQASPKSTDLLQKEIFDHYEPYSFKSPDEIYEYLSLKEPEGLMYLHLSKSIHSLSKAQHLYKKALSKMSYPLDDTVLCQCNATFVKLYFLLIYREFSCFEQLPEIFKLSSSPQFSHYIYHCYIKSLRADGELQTAQNFIKNLHTSDQKFLNLLKSYIE